MNKLPLWLLLVGLLSCQSQEQPSDVAARASGRYAVQSYVFNGDTLYSSAGINQLGVSELYIGIYRKGADTVQVGRFSVKNKINNSVIRDVGVQETNGIFRLSQPSAASTTYESRIEGNRFYEHSTPGGSLELPLGYTVKTPIDPAQKGLFIIAQKQP